MFFLLICGLQRGFAGEDNLTLETALSIAFQNNPRMVEARASIDEAKGELISAKTYLNPEAEFEIGGLKKEGEGRGISFDDFEIRQGFEPPGVRGLKTGIAKDSIAIRSETVKSVWSEVYLAVREVYARIILDKKKQELSRANHDAFGHFYARVQARFQSGEALKNDLQSAKIEVYRAENIHLSVEKELSTDKSKLNLLLGRELDLPFEVSGDLHEEDIELDIKEITSAALSNRPDLKAEELALELKTKAVALEELNRLPAPFLGFKRTTEEYENDSSVIVGINFPLWSMNQGEVQKALAQEKAQSVRLAALKKEIVFDVYEAYLNVELAKNQLDLLKQSMEEANELFRLADLRYSEGKLDFINYLDQVRTVNETRVSYYEGLFELSSAVNYMEKSVYASLREKEGFLK